MISFAIFKLDYFVHHLPQRLILHRKRFVTGFISSVALIAIAATGTTALARAPQLKAVKPITDEQDRIHL